LVITSACHAEGRGFESLHSRHFLFTVINKNLTGSFFLPKIPEIYRVTESSQTMRLMDPTEGLPTRRRYTVRGRSR